MLVLSRRPSEKILFPSVGISVEIIQTKGNTVRLGIEAPEDIRILRGELMCGETESLGAMQALDISNRVGMECIEESERIDISQRLDEIRLALRLAQNQRRQGLAEHSDVVLKQAIDSLCDLEGMLATVQTKGSAVCEANAGYRTCRSETSVVSGGGTARESRLDFEFAI